MKKYLFFILFLLIFLISIPVCVGGNNSSSSYVINESVYQSDDIIVALEDGHFNTSFTEGYNGYCLEYGEEEAKVGDEFYKQDTLSYDSSVYLKRYFIDYYDYAMIDKVVTQHMIWHFTDGFDGWRLNYTIIHNIKESNNFYPDVYVQDLNDTHCRIFDFCILLSPYEHHQDYFCYKIFEKLKYDENITNNNITFNNSVGFIDNYMDNCTCILLNETHTLHDTIYINQYILKDVNKGSLNHVCANPLSILSIGIFLLILITLLQEIFFKNL